MDEVSAAEENLVIFMVIANQPQSSEGFISLRLLVILSRGSVSRSFIYDSFIGEHRVVPSGRQ